MVNRMITKERVTQTITLLIGNILVAAGVAFFILPNDIIMGGTTGISIVLNYWFEISTEISVYAISITTFIIGWIILGKNFAMRTAVSTFFYPICLSFFNQIDISITDDQLLSCIYGGLLLGIGMGLVFRTGSSTGGMDTPPLIMNKLKGWSISTQINAYDSFILLLGLTTTVMEKALYGVLMTFIMSFVLSRVEVLGKSQTQIMIISKKYEEINNIILDKLSRGTTLLDSVGGYSKEENKVILTVISKRQVVEVSKIVHDTDPEAFMIISNAHEVKGRGFTF